MQRLIFQTTKDSIPVSASVLDINCSDLEDITDDNTTVDLNATGSTAYHESSIEVDDSIPAEKKSTYLVFEILKPQLVFNPKVRFVLLKVDSRLFAMC